MFETTKRIQEAIIEAFGGNEDNVRIAESDVEEVIYLFVEQEHHQIQQYEFSCAQGGGVLAISSAIAHVPEEKVDAVLKILNDGNRFLGLKSAMLYMQSDGDVKTAAALSSEHSPESIGKVVVEMLVSMKHTVDEIYPALMRCIWGGEEEDDE